MHITIRRITRPFGVERVNILLGRESINLIPNFLQEKNKPLQNLQEAQTRIEVLSLSPYQYSFLN